MINNLTDLINKFTELTILFTPFAILLAYFFWTMAQLILAGGDAEKKKQTRDRLLWVVVALFVVFSLGGIVALVKRTLIGN